MGSASTWNAGGWATLDGLVAIDVLGSEFVNEVARAGKLVNQSRGDSNGVCDGP
ncbi:MAG: hypothetical protein NVS9B8_12680 [Candidatus Limnocylindrales bacterium]